MRFQNIAAFIICGCLIFASCTKEAEKIPVTDITLNTASLTLVEGESAILIATISPSNADNQAVIWSSSNGSIASVSNGTVKALAAGTAIITAKSDDGWKTAQCSITVKSRNAIIISGSENLSPSFDSDGGKKTISFTSVGGPWTADFINGRTDGWCSISPSSGSEGQASLTITAAANTDFYERNASIVIKCGDSSKTVTVSQKQKDDITATKSKFELPSEGGAIEVEVKSNVYYSYKTSCDWISQTGTKAYESKKLTFNISKNDSVSKREGEIVFTSGNITEIVKVYQDGDLPAIVLTQNECPIGAEGGSIQVEVKSNVDVTMEIPADVTWIRELTTKSMSTNTYYLEVDRNTSPDSRSARIAFLNKSSGVSESIIVTQAQQDMIFLADSAVSFKWKASSKIIYVSTNIDISASVSSDNSEWISVSKAADTKALENKGYKITVSDNIGKERRAEITFSGEGCEASLSIIQDSGPIQADTSELIADCLSGSITEFQFTTLSDWKISGYDNSLFTVSPVSGKAGKNTLKIKTVSANCTNDDKKSSITLSSDGLEVTIPIKQIPAFRFDKLDYVIPSEGGSSYFYFTFPRNDYSVVKTLDYDKGFEDMLNSNAIPVDGNNYSKQEAVEISNAQIIQSKLYVRYNILSNCGVKERTGRFKLYFEENGQKLTSEWVNVTQTTGNYSRDYSQDGKVTVLQQHIKGKGIPIVIVGDGFTDVDISSGKYAQAMDEACQYFFSAEPLSSLQDYFDVWTITAVSPASTFNGSLTRFKSQFGSGTRITGDDSMAYKFASKVVPSDKLDDMLVIVVINSSKYAGTAYLHYGINYSTGKYSMLYSVAYVPMSQQYGMTFEDVIHHEACGHGFGKLADEYSEKGTVPSSEITTLRKFQEAGAYCNVDEHPNVNETLWARYAGDTRFSFEQLGAYEGAYTYSRGVYRPTVTSIMVSNKGIFNAPSRAQIYSRAMSISNNWNWAFDYESFVKFDEHIRSVIYSETSNSSNAKAMNIDSENYIPLAPPVFVLDN